MYVPGEERDRSDDRCVSDVPESLPDLLAERNRLVESGDWPNAASVARRILARFPENAVELRVASGILSRGAHAADAARYARRAAELDPTNAEFNLHAGCVLNHCGEHGEAVEFLLAAARLDASQPEVFQQLAAASERLDHRDLAVEFSFRAFHLDPANEHRGLAVIYLLCRLERLDEAVSLLRQVIDQAPPSAVLHRTLSGLLMQQSDCSAALAEIDAAITLAPDHSEYHIHRSGILLHLRRLEEAHRAVDQAIKLSPDDLVARRHAVSVLVEMGDIPQALPIGAGLLAQAPDEQEYAQCMQFLLDARSMRSAVADFGEIAASKRRSAPRGLTAPPTVSGAVRIQCRSIGAIVLRDIRSRYGESKLGFFWAIMEPFLHVGVLALVFQFTMHGRPPMGSSFFLFYFTGVMPYLLLSHLIVQNGQAIHASKPLLQIATITPVDLIAAKSLVELFTTAIVFLVFTALFTFFGVDAVPFQPLRVIAAFATTFVLGTGLGGLCAALGEFGRLAESVVSVLVRLMYFASGIFYVPGMMPVGARDILGWNPFLHIVDFGRTGFFSAYEPAWMDFGYAVVVSLFTFLAGLASVTAFRRRMREAR